MSTASISEYRYYWRLPAPGWREVGVGTGRNGCKGGGTGPKLVSTCVYVICVGTQGKAKTKKLLCSGIISRKE